MPVSSQLWWRFFSAIPIYAQTRKGNDMHPALILNLSLLILFPVSWAAPLVRAGVLPLFGLSEISVLSGLAALWDTDKALAIIVALFAMVAPMAKTLALAAIQLGLVSPRWLPPLTWLGRLAMADVFLIALYITLAKGIGIGRVETAWGLYLFTACILASLGLSVWTKRSGLTATPR